MNAFDGALTTRVIVIGASISDQLTNSMITIIPIIAGSIAMGTSGMSGAYMTEKADRKKTKKT